MHETLNANSQIIYRRTTLSPLRLARPAADQVNPETETLYKIITFSVCSLNISNSPWEQWSPYTSIYPDRLVRYSGIIPYSNIC